MVGAYAVNGSGDIFALTTGGRESWANPRDLVGDANEDGIVNGQDIAEIASHWLQTGGSVVGNVNGDEIVNGQDIAAVASHWLNSAAAVPLPTTLTLTAQPASLYSGQVDTLTASITPAETFGIVPSEGEVTFMDGNITLGTTNVVSGIATLSTSLLPIGTDVITATYSDSGGQYANSTSSVGSDSLITTAAGNGTSGFGGDGGTAAASTLSRPEGVAVDTAGDVYIADRDNNVVREIIHNTGVIITVAGIGDVDGYTGDGGMATSATLNSPSGVAMDATGDLFIADTGNNVIRKVAHATGVITTVAG